MSGGSPGVNIGKRADYESRQDGGTEGREVSFSRRWLASYLIWDCTAPYRMVFLKWFDCKNIAPKTTIAVTW